MAVSCFSSPNIPVQKSGLVIKPVRKIMMVKHSVIPLKKAPTLLVRSSFKKKVFENRSEGILCYVDDSGEIICEGYDEGPRFHQQVARTTYHPRGAEIINLLPQRLLQIVDGGEFNNVDNSVMALQEDFNWNGFNKFC